MNTALFVCAESELALVAWARHIAKRLGSDGLAVVCVSEHDVATFKQIASADALPDDAPELVAAAIRTCVEHDYSDAVVFDCRVVRAKRNTRDALRDLEVTQLILPAETNGASGRLAAAMRWLGYAAPIDVLVLDPTDLAGKGPERIVVPQDDGGGGFAMRLAAHAFRAPVVALADPVAMPRSERVFERAKERAAKNQETTFEQVTAGDSLDAGLRENVRAGDLVLTDADENGEVRAQIKRLAALRKDLEGVAFVGAVARGQAAAGPGRIERALERLRNHLPRLTRDQRREIHDLLDKGGRLSVDFVTMLMLSTAIATLGLIQSSTAVVVGAMLVAPLMTPIIAIGMGLVQANLQLFRAALRAMAVGVVAALLVAVVIAAFSPWDDLSAEVVARAGPNVFDLGIALFSGVAGAYALARPGAFGALVGVAIAVALVPPLASIGIALVKAEFDAALGAAVLFVTNLLAIITGSAVVFRLFGLELQGRRAPTWVRAATTAIALGFVPISLVLWTNLQDQVRAGVHRPYARPLPPILRDAVRDRVAETDGVELVIMAQSEIEHGFGVHLVLSCVDGRDLGLEADLRAIVRDGLGTDARVLWLEAPRPR